MSKDSVACKTMEKPISPSEGNLEHICFDCNPARPLKTSRGLTKHRFAYHLDLYPRTKSMTNTSQSGPPACLIPPSDLPFKCSMESCKASFPSYYQLKRHRVRENHPFQLPCSNCRKVFGNRKNLESHLERHQRRDNRTCTECGKRGFATNWILLRHVKRFHPDTIPQTKQRRARLPMKAKRSYCCVLHQ